MADKKPTDWEKIESEYRAGQLSVREIARTHEITDGAIRKKAKAENWQRDLSGRVRETVRNELVRSEVRTPNAHEREVVETAAARGVEVIRSHRKDLSRLRNIADKLSEWLEATIEGKPTNGRYFIGERESPSDMLVKLSQSLNRVIPLERQAFNLDETATEGKTHEDALNELR